MEMLTHYPIAERLRCWLTIGAYALWRTFQAAVVIPASVLGACLLVYASVQDAPVKTAVEGFYRFADAAIRQAPAGYVLVSQCAAPEQAQPARHTIPCQPAPPKQVPLHEAIDATARELSQVYLLLVMVSFGALVVFRPGRAFFGLRDAGNEKQASH